MALREAGWLAGWLPQTTGTHDIYIRVLVEMMGSQKYDNAGESQSSLIMNDPIISPRTRIGLPNPYVSNAVFWPGWRAPVAAEIPGAVWSLRRRRRWRQLLPWQPHCHRRCLLPGRDAMGRPSDAQKLRPITMAIIIVVTVSTCLRRLDRLDRLNRVRDSGLPHGRAAATLSRKRCRRRAPESPPDGLGATDNAPAAATCAAHVRRPRARVVQRPGQRHLHPPLRRTIHSHPIHPLAGSLTD